MAQKTVFICDECESEAPSRPVKRGGFIKHNIPEGWIKSTKDYEPGWQWKAKDLCGTCVRKEMSAHAQ